jgi:hypothetical protein
MVEPPGAVPSGDPTDDDEEAELPGFEEADDQDLEVDVHMQADETVGTLVANGDDFQDGRVNVFAVSDLIRSFGSALYNIALELKKLGDWVGEPDIVQFDFSSAHIRFVTGANETWRLDASGSPTVEASERIIDLMGADGDELLALAREVGTEGARAYKQFMKAVGSSENAEVEWKRSDDSVATITTARAIQAFQVLDREGEPAEPSEVTVPGHLRMADAGTLRFKLVLPKNWKRPSVLKGKRVIGGAYDEPVGALVKAEALWDQDVVAVLRIEREKAESVAAPREPKFHLVSVQPVVDAEPSSDDEEDETTLKPPTLLDEEESAAS